MTAVPFRDRPKSADSDARVSAHSDRPAQAGPTVPLTVCAAQVSSREHTETERPRRSRLDRLVPPVDDLLHNLVGHSYLLIATRGNPMTDNLTLDPKTSALLGMGFQTAVVDVIAIY